MKTERLAKLLLRLAVRLLPQEERERWSDEWMAELDAACVIGESGLLFVFDLWRGAGTMASVLHGRRAVLRTANAFRAGPTRPVVEPRPPYNAVVPFWPD